MSDNILVAVRVRSLITRELSDASDLHWQTGSDNTITQIEPSTQKPIYSPYKFDRVYGSDYNNLDVYFEVAEPIVESALAGFNGTIFAYGQTSSGKTYTMMGTRDCPGIIPLAIKNIFTAIENTPDREFLIRASYMEIYNENITDLLGPRESRGKGLNVREDTSGNVYVADLKEECVNCEESLLALMRKGDKNRHVGVTNMNERSSRSHTIFRLILESRERTEGDGSEEAVVVSQLNLVDLAGSENASQTGATGERLKEGGFINRSLFMLGRVISQLSDGDQFVNFRDSKLTRILQLSLGGNAKTAIICTVTPAAIEQTHSTLRFASRAKSIKNKPIVNEVLSEAALLKRYAKEIKQLRQSLEKERNTDKAQEVEQVREMLDMQARKNEDLQAKVTELKTMLVVSSLPRETNKKGIDKKKKARRETWAAPAARRAMRMSMAPLRVEPLNLDHEFMRPELPPWKDLGSISEENSSASITSPLNSSTASDGFGKEDLSFNMNLAEHSKLGKLEVSFNTPEILGSKRKRRVQFDFPKNFMDVECQTDESLIPKLNLLRSPCPSTPKKSSFASPGTPVHVLRARNTDLKLKLAEQDEWLKEWQTELSELRDFQRTELQMLEESFQLKIADGPIDNTKLDSQAKEITSLKHSLKDSETLLLDANRALSQKSQDVVLLQEQLQMLMEENERTCGFEAELGHLREENKKMKKALEEKEKSIMQFQNDKEDFDMMMELALDKQKGKENDLRRSLEAAWEEIANHEGGNVEAVKRRSMHVSHMETELDQLRKEQSKIDELKSNNEELQAQLEASKQKQQATEHIVEEQNLRLQEMTILVEKLKELDEQVSRIEALESELVKAQGEIDSKDQKNRHLQDTANALQMQLEERESIGTPARVRELEEEVEYLREKLDDGSSTGGSFVTPKPPQILNATQGDSTMVSLEISRKLSETLQVLEESVLLPSTPNRGSVSSLDEPFFQMQDFNFIKQQLLALQEALLIQDQQQQLQQQRLEDVKEEANHYSQIVAEVEEQNSMWLLAEALCADYIIHSQAPFPHATVQALPNHELDVEEKVQKAVEEMKIQVQAEYEAKLKEEHANFEARLSQESGLGREMVADVSGAPLSLADELKGTGMNMTFCNETFETSILNFDTDSSQQEVLRLKQQLDLHKIENSTLLDQIKQLTEEKKNTAEKSNTAEELQQTGMNMTMNMCDDTFETSILNLGSDSSNQEITRLRQQLELLNQENTQLHEQVKQLQLESSKSKEMKEQLETEMQAIVKEKEILESSVKSLEEQLSDSRIAEEEFHSLRGEADYLKQEKSELEAELQLMQEESKALEQKLDESLKEAQTEKKEITEKATCTETVDDDNNELHKTQQQVAELEKEKMKLEEELKEYKTATETKEVATSPQKESEDVNEINDQKEDSVVSSEDLFSEEETNNGDVAEVKISLEELQQKLEERTSELEEARKKILSLEVDYRLDSGELVDVKELVASNEELKKRFEEKSVELEKTNKMVEDLQAKNAENHALEELKKELDIAKEKIATLEREAEKQHVEFEEKISQIIAEKDSEMEMFITNFSSKEEALEEKLKELESANSEVVDIRKTLVSREFEVQNLTMECNALKTSVADLEKQLMQEQNKCADVTHKYEALEKENMGGSLEMENRMQELKNIISSHEEDLASKSEELIELKGSLEEQKKLLETAETEKQTLKELNEKKMLQESYNTSIKVEVEKSLDRDDHTILDDKLDELKQLKEEYSLKVQEHKRLQDCADNLKIVVSKKEEQLETMKMEHDQQVSSYIEHLNERDEKIQELESTISQSNEVRTNMAAALEAKDHKLNRQAAELEESRQSLESKERELQENQELAETVNSAQIKELQAEVEHLNKLHIEVCDDRKNMTEAIKKKDDIISDLQSEQNSLRNELENVTEDLTATKEKLKSCEDELSEKINIISNLESDQVQLQKDILELKSQDQVSRGEEEKMITIIEKYETEISEKESQIQIISKEVESKDSHISEMEKGLEKLQRRNNDLETELEELEEVKQKCRELEREVADHKEELAGAEGLREKVSSLENNLSALESDHQQKIDKYKEELAEAEGLHEKASSLEEKLSALESDYNLKSEKYQEEISCHVSEKEKLAENLSDTEARLERIRKEMIDVQERLEGATKALEAEAELAQAAKYKEAQLTSTIENLEEDLFSFSSCLTDKEEEMEKQKGEKLKLEEEVADLRAQGKALDDQLESNNLQIEKLVRIIEKYETEMSEKEVQLQQYEADKSKTEEQLQRLVVEMENKETSIKEAEETVQALQEKNQEMLDKVQELGVLKDKYNKIERELFEYKEMKNNLEDFPEKLRNTEKNLATLQSEYEGEIQRYKEEIAQYVAQQEEVLAKLNQTEGELHTFKEFVQTLKKELQDKEDALEEKKDECKRNSSEMESILKQLEKAGLEIQSYKEEIALYGKKDPEHLAQNELFIKLRKTEEELQNYKEQLQKLHKEVEEQEEAFREKEVECTRLDAEMDDIVQHFEKEGQWKADTIATMTQELTKVKDELKDTKQKLSESMMVCNQTTNRNGNSTNDMMMSELESQIKNQEEELKAKDEECDRLNAEMDELVEHYKKEGALYGELNNDLTNKLKEKEEQLKLTKSKLMELSRQESSIGGGESSLTVQYLREQMQEQEKELEVLKESMELLEKDRNLIQAQNKKLEQSVEKLRNEVEKGEQVRTSLQEELKVSSDTVDTLLERLGDLDKFKLVYEEEKAALEAQLQEHQQKIDILKAAAGESKDSLQQVELMEKIKCLESQLESSNKNFEEVADEVNRWKKEYTRQFEECEGLKAKIVTGEIFIKEQEQQYEQQISQLTTQLNTLVNSSVSSTPGLNITGKKKRSKASDLEQQRDSFILLCSEREKQIKELEETLESLRRSQGVVSTVEDFQRELEWMKKKMEGAENERDLLNKNFDSLEKDYEQLQKENEELQANSERTAFTDSTIEIQQLKKKIYQLTEENTSQKHDSGVTSKDSSTSEDEVSLRDRLVVLERENNELRFRLRALNAPAEKEVQSLREEINFANQKVTHLKAELRRLQNNKSMDSTICEMKGTNPHLEPKAENSQGNYDYSSASGVVMEVQVLGLKNMVYHLEKDKKQLQNECKTMDQHVDHYKRKAQEWKDMATKEKKMGEKMAKELESKRAEIKQYLTMIEENRGFSERQKFELGQHRETIAKLEKEKQYHLQRMQNESSAVTNTMRRQTMPVKQESNSEMSTGATNMEEAKTKIITNSTGTQLHLATHNAPLPSQTRIERLPGAKISTSDSQKADGKVPMWQTLNKENKDYSKYYLPQSTKKKQEEDCKTQ